MLSPNACCLSSNLLLKLWLLGLQDSFLTFPLTCLPLVTWDRIFNISIPESSGGHLSKQIYLAEQNKWLEKEDGKLIKKWLQDYGFKGKTNVLQQSWFIPIFRVMGKDLGLPDNLGSSCSLEGTHRAVIPSVWEYVFLG